MKYDEDKFTAENDVRQDKIEQGRFADLRAAALFGVHRDRLRGTCGRHGIGRRLGSLRSATTVYDYTTRLQKKGEGDNYSDIPTTPKTTHYDADAEQTGVPFYDAGTAGSFLSERAVHLLFGPDGTCNNTAAMGKSFSSSTTSEDGSFTMEHTVYGDILKITGKYRMTADGTIVLTLWDKDGKDQSFSLVLTLQPEFVENTTTSSETKPPAPVNQASEDYISTETKTTVKESTAVWKLGSITKNSVAYSGS